jgi:hypothetical protein
VRDGVHCYSYKASMAGTYVVRACVAGVHLRGSPATVVASTARAWAPACEVRGAPLELELVAGARAQGGGTCRSTQQRALPFCTQILSEQGPGEVNSQALESMNASWRSPSGQHGAVRANGFCQWGRPWHREPRWWAFALHAAAGGEAAFTIVAKDKQGTRKSLGGDAFTSCWALAGSDDAPHAGVVKDAGTGEYTCTFTAAKVWQRTLACAIGMRPLPEGKLFALDFPVHGPSVMLDCCCRASRRGRMRCQSCWMACTSAGAPSRRLSFLAPRTTRTRTLSAMAHSRLGLARRWGRAPPVGGNLVHGSNATRRHPGGRRPERLVETECSRCACCRRRCLARD